MKKTLLGLIIIPAVLITTSCTVSLGTSERPSQASHPSAATVEPVEKILSAFRPIQGTRFLVAEISADPNSREASNPISWIESGYSSYNYQTYNYVFFDLETETYHRLLPDNNAVILQIMGFPTPAYDASKPEELPPPIEWWLYTVVTKDSDQNGQLDFDDKLTLSVSDAGGHDYKEVITGVDDVLGQIYKNSSTLFIVYNSDSKNYIAKVNLPTREVVLTTEMDLGGDVK